ncbi:MAG: hypothetical protein U0X20_23005 [Caldilineaceae bacterium]
MMAIANLAASERIQHSVTVALRCVDGNSRHVLLQPVIRKGGLRFIRNIRGDYVLIDRPDLTGLDVTVEDPTEAYLPRAAAVALPRSLSAAAADSIFKPFELALYPAPAGRAPSGWASVRVTVVNAATDAPLRGALLRVVRTGPETVMARGVSDWRGRAAGEALVAVPRVPAITFGSAAGGDDGAVLVSSIGVSVEAIYDPQKPATDDALPDPDDLETRRAALPQASANTTISAGATQVLRIGIVIP